MPVQVTYPGVYVQEVSSGVRTITGVSTSIALFVGMTHQGPLREATRVLSFADYERTFGTDPAAGEMPDQVRQFFLNGGQQAYVMRIADDTAQPARVELRDEFAGGEVLSLEATSAGSLGETLRLVVDYNTANPESTFNLIVVREETDGGGVVQVAETEIFDNLTMNPESPNYAVNRVNLVSNLVQAEPGGALPSTIEGFSLAGALMTPDTYDALEDAFDALPDADDTGSFQISVDGSPFVPVTISLPTGNTQQDVDTAIRNPILTALAPFNRSVTVSADAVGGTRRLVITSEQDGGNVRIAPAQSRDIAVAMQMGVAQGGLEVDGFAPQRPASNGFFSVLGPAAGDLTALDNFLAADPANFDELEVAGVGTGTVGPLAGAWPATGNTFATGAVVGNSLLNARHNLEFLANQVNASPLEWTAARHGYRLVLTPGFGGPNGGLGATITSDTDATIAAQLFGQTVNVQQYRMGGFGAANGPYQDGVQQGQNGGFPELGDYQDAYEIADREVDLFNLLILPRAAGQQDAQRLALWGPSSAFVQQRRAFLIVDPRDGLTWGDINDVTDGTIGVDNLRLGMVNDHAALYWPRLRIAAPEGGERTIDPSGTVAGLMARTDANRGVWKAPAGLEASLRGVRGVENAMSDPENGVINPAAVNAIRVFPNGIVTWGSRTLDGFDNSGNDDYKYVPVRRLALFIEESLYRGLRFAVFEPNDEPLWRQLRQAGGAFMNNLFRQGAFQGQKSSEAYFVKVDSETTTQNDINLGIVNVVVGFAPLKPAEFVVITVRQIAGQVQV